MAEATDMVMDDNLVRELDEDTHHANKRKVSKQKATLSHLLSQELRPIGSKRKFRQIHEDLQEELTSSGAYRPRDAKSDLSKKKGSKRYRRKK